MMVRGAMWALALSLSLPGVHTELATSFTPRNRLSVLERNLPGPLFPSVSKHLCSKAPGSPGAEAAVVCCAVRFMRVQLSGLLCGGQLWTSKNEALSL